MNRSLKIAAIIMLVVSAIGFLDATYLTIEHYRGEVPFCTIEGCKAVLTSRQAEIMGAPVALLGAVYYLVILILVIAYLDRQNQSVLRFATLTTIVGLVASAYFVSLQLFVIKSICQYCMISAGTSTLLFITGMYARLNLNSSASARSGSVEGVRD